jgi:thiol-disulfide isomerase/thioredoxin
MKEITGPADWEAMKQVEGTVCVLFSSPQCIDCRIIAPILPDLEREFGDRMTFYNVDREGFPEIYREEDIFGIPSFLIYRQGREVDRWVTTLRKTREEIEGFLTRGAEKAAAAV